MELRWSTGNKFNFVERGGSRYCWYAGHDGTRDVAVIVWPQEGEPIKRQRLENWDGHPFYVKLQPPVKWNDLFTNKGVRIDLKDIKKKSRSVQQRGRRR